MARYDYRCEDCGHEFEVVEHMEDHEAGKSPPCPDCGSEETRQLFRPFFAETSDKTI